MATIKPSKGIRSPQDLVGQVASRPYDVLNSEETRAEAAENRKSLYHIVKPEMDFSVETDEHGGKIYTKTAESLRLFRDKGWLVQDDRKNCYIYAQTMSSKMQYGLVVGTYVLDYMNGVIKRRELTRRDKEEDRTKHVRANNADIEPVFFVYPDNAVPDTIIRRYTAQKPVYDLIALGNGSGHTFWMIDDDGDVAVITKGFAAMLTLYIADGHHRLAAAALVGVEKAKQNPGHRGGEEYNYFMAVYFPTNQLTVINYNWVVKDLNGLTPTEFLVALEENFVVGEKRKEIYKPAALYNFALCLEGKWYSLTAKPGTYDDNSPIEVLDMTISSNLILDEILAIKGLHSDKRIDSAEGIRGLDELSKQVDSGEMKVTLALYPVPIKQLMDIADTESIMPPRTTWFEPKLRSGLVVYELE